MQISIHSSGFVLTEALRAYIVQRLHTALRRAGERMRNVHVWLSDINGPRGGRDKRCKIQLRMAGGKDVLIEDTEADLYHAIDLAAQRADRAVVRRVEHLRELPRPRKADNPVEAVGDDEHGDDR